MEETGPLHPPAEIPEILRGSWIDLPADDPVANYWSTRSSHLPGDPSCWEVARLHHTVFLYREKTTGWSVAAKYYVRKTPHAPDRYAQQEFAITQEAYASFFTPGRFCAVEPYGVWRGVLFIENVDGLNLGDIIAVRRSRPGALPASLEAAAALLADLHSRTARPDLTPEFAHHLAYGYEMAQQLSEFGVLQADPLTRSGLERLLGRWAEHPPMQDFVPSRIHGDATTSNFIFPRDGLPTAIDWERCSLADPAADLGRLLAEISHSIQENGGSSMEAEPLLDLTCQAYRRSDETGAGNEALLHRATFYRAVSTLRIARNGWISRENRLRLVAQAMGLLTGL